MPSCSLETNDQPPAKRNKKLMSSVLSRSRCINVNQIAVEKHPLNIKPSGNLIFAKDEDLIKIGESAGPMFKKLPDDIILKILGFLDKDDLRNCTRVSRFWYAYASFDELWRSMYTLSSPEQRIQKGIDFKQWRGSWKASILNFELESNGAVDCNGVYSDTLFTPYSNSCVDYNVLFKDIIEEQKMLKQIDGYWDANILTNPSSFPYRGRIPRIDEKTFTYEMFENNHWNAHPFILGSNDKTYSENRWPKWTIEFLLKNFPNVTFRQESVLWELALYEDYAVRNRDENPLYLFDCRSTAMKTLLPTGYFPNPPIFAEKDLLKIFNDCRPDHSWIITGPERSGSTFHKDPNSTDAWNVSLQGSKLWIMLPPEMKPPGVFVSDDESEVISPHGLAEWVKSGFWNDSIQISDEATLDIKNEATHGSGGFRTCVIGITFENECMYVPSGWWHSVINLQDSVAFTANFIPPCKISNVLNFMKNKPDQVSGFRHDLLQAKIREFLSEHDAKKGKTEQNENINILRNYLELKEFRNLDEDVGELKGTGCMPVYEAFVELLLANGHDEIVEKGLKHLEREEPAQSLKKSHVWEELTQEGKTETKSFSFGFDLDDE